MFTHGFWLLCSHTDFGYYVHTRILLRESCVIQTTVLVNSDDRPVYCPRRSRFRPPINTTLLTSPRMHSHLHPPLPLSLKSLPWRRRSAHAPMRRRCPPRKLSRRAAKRRTPTCHRTRLRWTRPVQSLAVEVDATG